MMTIVLVVHLLIALGLVVTVLLQRSEGGGLGIGGGGGMMTGRASANLLTRATAGLAACFFVTSLTLAILASGSQSPGSILDESSGRPPAAAPAVPAQPAEPSVPLAQ